MTQEIKTIDDLFNRIDDELIILSEAHKNGRYEWFDFVAALRLLNDRLKNEGYNEYRTRKVSKLVNVFNDLCHTVAQSFSYRTLSYDKERKIAITEWRVFGKESRTETIEQTVIRDLEEYYESLSLPETKFHSGDHLQIVKIKYLLRDCKEDSSQLESIYYPELHGNNALSETGWDSWAVKHFYLLDEERGDFNAIFNIDSNVLYNNRITFEEYITELTAERNILSGSAKTTFKPNSKTDHFSVDKSYEEMQRILTALQQGGFVSMDTTIDTFYYRMTGKGTPTNDKIGWIKKGKKNNSSISKRSLVYFVETITNCRVSKAKDCTNLIKDIFGLSLSSSTINSTAVCEYKKELDCILQGE